MQIDTDFDIAAVLDAFCVHGIWRYSIWVRYEDEQYEGKGMVSVCDVVVNALDGCVVNRNLKYDVV